MSYATLEALKPDRGVTCKPLACAVPPDAGLVFAQMRRFGDELCSQHEFIRAGCKLRARDERLPGLEASV